MEKQLIAEKNKILDTFNHSSGTCYTIPKTSLKFQGRNGLRELKKFAESRGYYELKVNDLTETRNSYSIYKF